MLKCSSAWIAGSSPAMTNTKSFSRRTCVRVVLTTTHQKIRRPAKKPREAERRKAHASMSAHRRQVSAVCATRLRAEAARRRGPLAFRRSAAALAKATERFGSAGPRFTRRRGRRRYRHRRSRLSGAPRTPVVVPQGTMPEPGNGVTSPARRNRTRSINRPSPVASLERTGIVPVT
jgi:hypothetical protein